MSGIITKVRLSFLKLKNLNFPNKLVAKECCLKSQKKTSLSGFNIYHRKAIASVNENNRARNTSLYYK